MKQPFESSPPLGRVAALALGVGCTTPANAAWSPDAAHTAVTATWIALGAAFLWLLIRQMRSSRASGRPGGRLRTQARRAVPAAIVFVATGALIVLETSQVFEDHEDKEFARLQAVAQFQAAQLADWLDERRADAEFVRTSLFLATLYARWEQTRDEASRAALIGRLRQISAPSIYADVLLIADDGLAVWTREAAHAGPASRLRDAIRAARRDFKVVTVGPYRDAAGRVHLDFVAPLLREPGQASRAAVVLRTDPSHTIAPLLAAWPALSGSAETVLVEQREDKIVYLNELRHRPDAAVQFERSANDRRLLAVQVRAADYLRGSRVRGIDYRDMPVLGAGQPVRGTNWNVIAKIDLDEARADAIGHAWLIVASGLIALLAAAGAVVLWRQRQELQFEHRLQADQAQKLRAVRDRERRLSAIIDHSPSALSMKDREGAYVVANPHLQRLLGMTEAQILGRKDVELHPAPVAQMLRENDERVLHTRRARQVEETFPSPAGPRIYASYLFPVLDDDGEVQHVCRIALDVTEQRHAAAALGHLAAELSSTLQAIPDLLFELDEHGRYLSVRTTRLERLAAPIDAMLGRTVAEMLPPDAARTVMAALAAAGRVGTDYGRTIELVLADGPRQFELSVAAKAATPGEPRRYIVLSRDVTSRRTIEADLRKRTEELARRNEELERFNRLTVGRELDMIELKKEVNALLAQLGRCDRYPIPRGDGRGDAGDPA